MAAHFGRLGGGGGGRGGGNTRFVYFKKLVRPYPEVCFKLTWLVLGGDPAARSHRVEQLTAL